MSIFSRLFKISQAETHSIVNNFEDPVKMTEQGIRDLRKDFQQAVNSLAEVKAVAIRTRKKAETQKGMAADYERKAMLLLQKMQSGGLPQQEAERMATHSLIKKEEHAGEAVRLAQEAASHEEMAGQLQVKMNKIRSVISGYENDLITLKARAKTAAATKKINRQLGKIDTSGTIAMLERMKAKVEEDESLALAYGDIADADKSIDDEINSVLHGGPRADVNASLLELKMRMGIKG